MKRNARQYILSDYLFTKIYSIPRCIKSFLKAFCEVAGLIEPIEEIEKFTEKNLKVNKRKRKQMRTDLLIYTEHYIFIIEAYTSLNMEGLKKAEKYTSKIDAEQLGEGEKYKLSRKVILIIIADNVQDSLDLDESWYQRYNPKGEGPNYKKLPSDIEIFILRVDKLPKVGYYDVRNNLLLKHLRLIKERSPKIRKQLAREDEDLMTIATYPSDFMHDEEIYKYHNMETKARDIGYGNGYEKGYGDRTIEIAKSMLEENTSKEYISKITKISLEQLEKLQEEMKKEKIC